MKINNILIPADVPQPAQKEYHSNYSAVTRETGRLMLFAADQKIEHLNADFYGPEIDPAAANPQHLFEIANKGSIGAFATHLGLIARYAGTYNNINYIAKLNAKTNLVSTKQAEPNSSNLWGVKEIMEMKKDGGINICGIGITIYIGSEHEGEMLAHAAHEIYKAHRHGLMTVAWIYPRGKAIRDDTNADLIAGAAGIANSLGADFVKVKPPAKDSTQTSEQLLKQAVTAAGNTQLICSGGTREKPQQFLQTLYNQIHVSGVAGNATGRNIFQYSVEKSIAMTKAISAIVYDNASVEQALKFL